MRRHPMRLTPSASRLCTRHEQCASDLQGGGQALLDGRQPQVMNSAEQVQQDLKCSVKRRQALRGRNLAKE